MRKPDINYVCGKQITVTFDSAKVSDVKVIDSDPPCGGMYLEATADSVVKRAPSGATSPTTPARTPPGGTPPRSPTPTTTPVIPPKKP
jgi:hypothetical protein